MNIIVSDYFRSEGNAANKNFSSVAGGKKKKKGDGM